jgi:hypothetical protein
LSRAAPTVALGLLCSLAAALPGFIRASSLGVLGLLALTGSVSLVVVPVGLWIRRAKAAGFPAADRALLAGAGLSALPLALFGGVLKSTTHHRPLGGATFAVAALCLLAICIGLGFRLWGSARAASKSPWQSLFILASVASLAGALLLGMATVTRPAVLDFLAAVLASVGVAYLKIPAWLERVKAALPFGLWAALVLGALLSIQSPGLARSLTTQAPVSFAPLSWLGGGS